MPENRDDRMMLTLDALRRDVERTPLADSLTVRRRGDRRTRRQAVGGALAVVALIAGAAGIYGGLDGDKRATRVPASPSPERRADSRARRCPVPHAIGPRCSRHGIRRRRPLHRRRPGAGRAASGMPGPAGRLGCLGGPLDPLLPGRSEVSIYEYVLRFPDPAAAAGALDRIGADLAACPAVDPKDGTLTVRGPQPVDGLPDARQASRDFVPSVASETHYGEAAAAQRSNVVVVLDWAAYGNPGDGAGGWAWDAGRLQVALDRAVT